MSSGIFALLSRSLRVDARSLRTHLFRGLLVGSIYLSLYWAKVTSLIVAAPGLRFFQSMMYLNLVFITLAGLSLFASAITEEKEEDTLGLLKLAGLDRLRLLLGKSTSRLVVGLLLLLVQFPFTLLAVTLGGVTYPQIIAAYATLLAYLMLVANLGLLCSVLFRRTSGAAGGAGILLFLVLVGPSILLSMRPVLTGTAGSFLLPAAQWLRDASAWRRIGVTLQSTFAGSAVGYQVLSNLGASAVFFVLAWMAFEPFSQGQQRPAPARGLRRGRSARFRWFSPSRSWPAARALMWKDFYFIGGGVGWMLVRFVAYGVILAGIGMLFWNLTSMVRLEDVAGVLMGVAVVILVVDLCYYASRIFHDEVKWQTVPALMMLPLGPAQIASSKAAGCLLGLGPAVFYVLASSLFVPEAWEVFAEPGMWTALLGFGVFLHLTAFLSLYVKWGALLLAFGIVYLTQTLFGCLLSPLFLVVPNPGQVPWNLFHVVLSIILGGVIVGLQYGICRRLTTLAAR